MLGRQARGKSVAAAHSGSGARLLPAPGIPELGRFQRRASPFVVFPEVASKVGLHATSVDSHAGG